MDPNEEDTDSTDWDASSQEDEEEEEEGGKVCVREMCAMTYLSTGLTG